MSRRRVKYYSPKRRKVYAQGDPIDALTLFELFNWHCYICKKPIDRRRRCPDWKAATIDHFVPLALGGGHTWDNVVPAHLKCNTAKGTSHGLGFALDTGG
jgi:5-methylcytosine-specific restriction endonuclease McrA